MWTRGAKYALLGMSAWVVSCSDDGPPLAGQPDAAEPAPDARPAPPNDLTWSTCSLFTGGTDAEAECALTALPLSGRDPDQGTIEVFVKRYRRVEAPRGQLWLLNGGPGGSSVDFEDAITLFLEAAPDLELYFIDHRGTGRSARLSCSDTEALSGAPTLTAIREHWAGCLDELVATWGTSLNGFSTTEAARDLGTLIERTRHGQEEVYLYGVSYGTYWAQRYLQLFPDQADGVVLDSICPPGQCQLAWRFDEQFNETGRMLLGECATRATCSERLGDDPWGFLDRLYQKLDQGHCSQTGVSRDGLRQLLGSMLMYVGLRDYVPATLYRLDRCEPEDVEAIELVGSYVESVVDVSDPYGSEVLALHIGLSELVEDPPPSYDDTASHVESLFFSLDVGLEFAALAEPWPRYPKDEYYGVFPDTKVPMLLLSGEFDPQTPPDVARPAAEHFVDEHQTYVSVPWSAHTVLTQSPVDTIDSAETCGLLLIAQFLGAPAASLDTSCTERVVGIDFDGLGPVASEILFGQADAWDNIAPLPDAAGLALQSFSQSSGPAPALPLPPRRSGPLSGR